MDDELQQLLRLPIGDRTDRFLHLLLEPRFLGYWTFARPLDRGVEIADVLTWYDDVVLLFEAKTRAVGTSDLRWAARNLEDAITTINERATLLRNGQVQSFRNKWRGQVQWDPTRVRDYYGVVVLNHLSEPFDPRELVPTAFRQSAIPIQVFSLEDLTGVPPISWTPQSEA